MKLGFPLDLGDLTATSDFPESTAAPWSLRSRLWLRPASFGRLHVSPIESFNVRAVLQLDGGADALPNTHGLWTGRYDARPFTTCIAADVVMTHAAKLVSLGEAGVMRDFMVGPEATWPKALLDVDFAERSPRRPWRTRRNVRVERIGGLSIPLCHYGVDTFGHFVLDALLQIYLHRDVLASGEGRLVHWPLSRPWMAPLLDACGAPAGVRREVHGGAILMEKARLSSALAAHGVYFPATYSRAFFDWLRATLTDGVAPKKWRRLYVRRSEATRAVIEQLQLERRLAARGFEVLDPTALSVQAQAQLISEAEVLVSAWGSGLTLAPLLGGRREVVELTPLNLTDPWFVRQAAVHGLSYTPIPHASADGSITPDVEAIDRVLDRIDAV